MKVRLAKTLTYCVLVLDSSGSQYLRVALLNQFLSQVPASFTDPEVRSLVRLSIVVFYEDEVLATPFLPLDEVEVPILEARGGTPYGPALAQLPGLFVDSGILAEAIAPNLVTFMLTDAELDLGENADWREPLARYSAFLAQRDGQHIAFALPGCSREALAEVSPPGAEIYDLDEASIGQAFEFVVAKTSSISAGTPAPRFEPKTLRGVESK